MMLKMTNIYSHMGDDKSQNKGSPKKKIYIYIFIYIDLKKKPQSGKKTQFHILIFSDFLPQTFF